MRLPSVIVLPRIRTLAVGLLASALVALFGACGSDSTSSASSVEQTTVEAPKCPTRGLSALPNRNQAARNELVPEGADSVRVCRYKESQRVQNGSISQVLDEASISGPKAIGRLRSLFAALDTVPRGAKTCAEPTTRIHYLVSFFYPDAPVVHVRVVLAGCPFVRNEVDPNVYAPSRGLRQALFRLVTSSSG